MGQNRAVDVLTAGSETDTPARLMAAAVEVLARHGYEATTVREICRLAGTNVAAVHDHFADKRRHYLAILESVFTLMRRRRSAFLPSDTEALYSIVQGLLPTGAPFARVIDCAESVVGQIRYAYHAGPIIERLHPDRPPVARRLQDLVHHIRMFSLGGIAQLAGTLAEP